MKIIFQAQYVESYCWSQNWVNSKFGVENLTKGFCNDYNCWSRSWSKGLLDCNL